LVRDRAAVLTVRAAVRGVIDYSQARLLDPDWWRRHYILVKEMEREDDLRLYERVLSQYQALVSNSGLTEESFKKTQDSAHDAFQDILCLLRPWEGATASERKQREVTDLKGAYFRAFNIDPNDPNWQERERQKVEDWKAERERQRATNVESDFDRVTRLRQEKQRLEDMRRKIKNSRDW
jgi:hypothetical protein